MAKSPVSLLRSASGLVPRPIRGTDRDRAAAVARRAADRLLDDPGVDPAIPAVTADDGTPLYTEVRGPAGGVPIVLVHGWSCHGRVWNAQINALAGDHRVIVYDQRGHGRSPSGRAEPTIATLGKDLAAVVRATVAPGAGAVIVGHSMGGMSVTSWARRDAAEMARYTRAAMLVSTASGRLLEDIGVLPMPERLPGAHAIGRAAMSAPLPGTLIPGFALDYVAVGPGATRRQALFTRQIIARSSGRRRGRWGEALGRLELADGVEALPVPTTVLVGTADRLTPPVHSERMADLLNRAGTLERHVVLDKVGHMAPVEDPHRVNAEIEHLAGLPAAA